jgi:hypothetical protein
MHRAINSALPGEVPASAERNPTYQQKLMAAIFPILSSISDNQIELNIGRVARRATSPAWRATGPFSRVSAHNARNARRQRASQCREHPRSILHWQRARRTRTALALPFAAQVLQKQILPSPAETRAARAVHRSQVLQAHQQRSTHKTAYEERA